METTDIKRMKELEKENRRFKQMYGITEGKVISLEVPWSNGT